jgi:peroxiredoxin Q/BCP
MTSVILMLALLQDKAVDLKVGDAAPKFEALDDSGKTWKSEDHVGKKAIVLYFYPASFTGGCTAQAKAFQADMKKFADQNVEVVGVSGDTVRGQEAFKKYFKLDFTLLSDEKGDAAAKLYGVPLKPGGPSSRRSATRSRSSPAACRWTAGPS